AGKSTTLGVLAGFLFARRGTLRLDGVSVPLERWSPRAGLSYLPERPIIDERVTPWQWCDFVASLKGVTPSADSADLLACLGLDEDYMHAPLATLSFGTIRKVALFAELVTTSRCLIMDEPLSGLDPAAVEGFHDALRAFVRTGKRSVLLSTHLLGEAEAVASHVGVIVDGRTIAEGSVSEVCGSESLRATYRRLTAKPRVVVESNR
ncbi:MAG: ABC transporter ATP-binding protein, partial [Gemmatimonadaceae bacterium]|nr:ABC transporter ATP-binding protein [Gemmatimonadaceae bacterium]